MSTEPTTPPAVVALAAMRRADLARVVAIDASASPRPWSETAFLAELGRDDRCYLVARLSVEGGEDDSSAGRDVGAEDEGGALVGFVGAALFPGEAHVMTVAVDPAARGRGIGARLVAGMLDEVARADLGAVTLEVRESNVAAKRVYRRAGFVEAGVRPAYYPDGEVAVIMWCRRGPEVS